MIFLLVVFGTLAIFCSIYTLDSIPPALDFSACVLKYILARFFGE